jgi:hypothetical protein
MKMSKKIFFTLGLQLASGLVLSQCCMETPVNNNTVTDDPPIVEDASFTMISNEQWDETAVRKVLHLFAYSGFADDAQIAEWAAMDPGTAIVEMITADTTNPSLSPPDPYDRLDLHAATLTALHSLWSGVGCGNRMPFKEREYFATDAYNAPARTWLHAATKRGLNPVRQKLGIFETNYHLAINQSVPVSNRQVFAYYDDIMTSLAAHSPYQNILAGAALSAAIAVQYNHLENKFINAQFEGNEDFAREYHQLFFGILGEYDHAYHELTTIRNTAKALTDIRVETVKVGKYHYGSAEVTCGTEFHYPGSLEILHFDIDGATAREKIENLSQHAIYHQESLDNLPVIIARGLADDNLDSEKIEQLKAIWAGLAPKDLLTFLRKYAISTTFHHPTRVKYWSSIDRHLIICNRLTLNNQESYLGYYYPESMIRTEGVELFRPIHNVFGHQTGPEASDDPGIFKEAYNNSIDRYWFFARTEKEEDGWQKEWESMIPRGEDGTYRVQQVAEWLWNRFAADGLANFGALERAYVYSFLGSGRDFGYFVDAADARRTYTEDEMNADPVLQERMHDLAIAALYLDSDDSQKRKDAQYRVGLAIAFITATPYVFAQEGI